MIKEVFLRKHRKAGWRTIKMNLERQAVIMNHKKTHYLSTSLGMELSLEVVRQAINQLGEKTVKGALIHSDQGFHYTHPSYIQYLRKLGVVQSMSRKGNCLDNAPTESFFGHMKDEIDLTSCYSIDQVSNAVAEYTDDYNHLRYQWTRKKMAPTEYRNHLLAAQ